MGRALRQGALLLSAHADRWFRVAAPLGLREVGEGMDEAGSDGVGAGPVRVPSHHLHRFLLL